MPNPFGLSLACPEPIEGSKPCPRAARPFLRYLRTIGIQAQGERLNEQYWGKPGIISFAGGFPDSAMFEVDGINLETAVECA